MDENSIRDAVQRFRFDRFKAEEEEWVYYVQRFETELALHRLLVGDNTADTRRNLLLSKARKEEETVTQFLIALRAIAGNCEFGASLSERLRDQLAIGINNDAWQKELFRLHTTNDATLQQVEASALILEQASTQQESIRQMAAPQEKGSEVHRLREARKQIPQFQRKSEHRELDASRDCVRCGYSRHKKVEECPAKGQTCNACGGLNHYARVCLKSGKVSIKGQKGKKRINAMKQAKETGGTESSNDDDQDISCGEVNTIHIRAVKGCAARLEAEINGVRVKMLYDPGAARSVISEHTWRKVGAPSLKPTDTLVAYTNVPVETLGETEVRVRAFGRVKHLLVSVVKEQDKPLFGLDWCVSFNLNMPKGVTICNVKPKLKKESGSMEHQDYTELASLLLEFGELFAEEPGTIVGHKAVVHLKEGAVPKLYSARPIPFPMKKAVEDELNRLSSGGVRLCVDFRVTINPHVYVDPHPHPRFEDIIAKLSGSKTFSIVDLTDAYLQMEVDPSSRKFMVVATHKGYFQYKRLPFEVNFAPAIFQKTMEKILAGIDKVAVYIGDIIVGGSSKEEHIRILREVFVRLRDANVRAKKSKCRFVQKEVVYLGYRIDEHGVHPTEEHLEAIQSMPTPTNAKELRSFLGMINYYSRFIANLQPICAPLHALTKHSVNWTWSKESDKIFQHLKLILSARDTLVHYREELPLILETDASDRGVGAVLLHQLPDKSERPVAFASRTFLDREKNYSVIDKEALAIIFGVTKFYQYVYGRKFTLRTDHKPLEHILGANQEIPKMAANRLQRWAITLSAYQYDLQYVKGKENLLADPLSRLPMNVSSTSAEEDVGHHSALLNVRIEDLPMSKRDLQKRTRQDPLLAQVINCVDRGWPSDRKQIPAELLTFYEKRETLSFEENILLWQGRIVVPTALHRNVLDTLHEGHPGIWAMRALARYYVWWPHIDDDVETYVKKCKACQQNRPHEHETLLFSWNVPTEPWQRIHIDYAGPFEGSSWLVVVDAFSKWIEIKPQRSTTTSGTVKALREIFCRFGLPRVIVSDNGPQFSSQEFKQFCDSNNIVHIRSTPYHPKTNGLAERAVRTFKERFLASQGSTDDVELRLQRFLLSYRNTPHKSTGRAPAEMLMGRKLRTKLDLLKPDPLSYMDQAVIKQKLYHDQGAKLRIFRDGGYNDQQAKETGGQVKRKHADQLRTKMASEQCISEELMHNDPARVNGRQVLDVDATHTETQGTKRGDEGSHQVPHRSPEMLKEGADGCQGFQTSEVPGVPTISNETVQDEQTHKTNGSTHTQEEQEEPTLPTVSSGSVQQKERPKRDRRPPSRPYDKYLSNPRAK
ncbi:hypothetical protein EMCRGX_G029003 [Ephydatia muelleri]